MNPLDMTLSEVRIAKNGVSVFLPSLDRIIELFLERFKGQSCLNDDSNEDDVSMEFKESFFKLMEARNLAAESIALLDDFCRSLEFVKSQELQYVDSGQIVQRENMHEFLMENVSVGCEGEWRILFETIPPNIPNLICYSNGKILYRSTLKDVSDHAHKTYEHNKDFDKNDLFPKDCLAEKTAFALLTPENNLVKVVG